METDTRKRRVNFSTPELEVLRIEVELRKSMLFAKLSSSMTREKKMRAWEVVAQRVSAVSCTGVSRTADEVRKKWSNIATGTKKRKSLERKEMRKTGGGPAHVTDGAKQQWDDSVAGIIGPTAIQGVEGGVDTSEPLVVQDIWDLSCNHTVPPPHVADDTADEPATSASPQPATEMASSEPDEIQNDMPNTFVQEKVRNPRPEKLQVTWIGHATVLVQLHGVNILTDPVFCNKVGFYNRYSQPACKINELPHLDAVLISHDHSDHLDIASVKEIQTRFPKVRWILPKGIGDLFNKKVCQDSPEQVKQLTWWEEHVETFETRTEKGETTVPITFVCTPAQHWSCRNKRLWCTWVVKSDEQSFYFAGDTGYHAPLFKKIGELYGPFSLATIPIGAYESRNITEYQHICPIESVQVHRDVKAEYSVAIHWGAFSMTNEYFFEPPQFLEVVMKQAWKEAKTDNAVSTNDRARLDPSRFTSLELGQTWVVGEDRGPTPEFMKIDIEYLESKTMKEFRDKMLLDSDS